MRHCKNSAQVRSLLGVGHRQRRGVLDGVFGQGSPRGNPQARNLFGIIGYLQKQAGVEFHVEPTPPR
ncbi:hypothetical protein [Methylocystis sp. Sn-Cys]|uniref:hypothetical protein n=1 Tax=Methylocystis sp. Sn-Cys TaxID=1701263 RepID=UPI001922F176|nr:hypothetical protein [Methylocystis sp. Sn-Cys]MBL1258867.1 hypothetical protein [Methylocystis sp. Sn-Cys]